MRLFEPPSDRSILQVYDVDKNTLEMTILAIPAYRLGPREIPGSLSMKVQADKHRRSVPGSIRETTLA
jgi:hypothetical protein